MFLWKSPETIENNYLYNITEGISVDLKKQSLNIFVPLQAGPVVIGW